MSRLLRRKLFWLLVLLFSSGPMAYVWSQVGCNGFDGSPQPSGGVNSISNGTLCLNAPNPTPAEIEIIATNVADGSNPNNFAVIIDWDDGSPEQTIVFGGAIQVVQTGPHAYRIPSVTHQFLPKPCNATMGRQCAYKPRIYLRIAGTRCPAEFGNPPDFFRFNTDDQCSGNMEISETATGAPVFEVCAGTQTVVTFTDRTRLNCLPPQELTGLNSSRRWRRIVYGTAGSNISGILVNGVNVGANFNATVAPDVSGQPLATSAPPFANNQTLPISVPATATVGQEYHIRMEYWNFCNQYDDGVGGAPPVNGDNAPVIVEGIIRVVDQPPPPTANHQVVCNGITPLPNFQVNITQPRNAVLWYQDNAGSPGAPVANPNGTNNINFPVSAYPGGINANTAGVYRLWASYRSPVGAGSLLCESPRVPVTLTIRESIPTPGPLSGTNEICNGSSGVSYSVPVAAAAFPIGGPTEYQWDVVNAANGTANDVTLALQPDGRTVLANFNIPDATFGGAPSIVRKIRVRRRYTTNSTFPGGSTCPSARAEFTVTVFRNTQSGNLAGGGNFCEGENLGNLTWTPGVGIIQRWEISSDGGATFSSAVALGTANPVNPTSLGLTPGTYLFRAIIQNGVCPQVATGTRSFAISPNPDVAMAGSDQDVCIPAGALTAPLAGNVPGAGVNGGWSVVTGPGTAIFSPSTSAPNASVEVTVPGNYTLRWTLSNATCNSSDDVVIGFGREPRTPDPRADVFCSLSGSLDVNTLPAAPFFENVRWSFVSGPGSATITNESQIPATVSVSAFGTYRFDLTYSSGSCTPRSTEVEIVFAQPPASLPEEEKVVCVDGILLDPFPISGNIADGAAGGGTGQGRWEISTGTGTFVSSNAATGSLLAGPVINDNYRASAADYANGFVVLRLRAMGGLCADAMETVRIDFDKNPAPAAVGSDISVCGTTASLNAVAPTEGGSGVWSVITVGPDIVDPENLTTGVNNLQFGANQFQWTVTSALGVCPSSNATFTVTRTNAPVANSISPNDLCESNPNTSTELSVDLEARYTNQITGGAAGVVVEWFTNPARTTPVPNINNRDVADGSVYYIRVNTTGTPVCSTDGVVNFTVNAKPFVANLNPQQCEEVFGGGVVNNVNLTNFNNEVALNLPNRSVTWFTDDQLTVAVANANDVDGITNNAIYYARVVNTVSGCFNRSEVTFRVNNIPEDNPIEGPNKVCLDPDNVIFFKVATLKASHTYLWSVPPLPDGAVNVTGITNDFFVLLQFPNVVNGGIDLEVIETSPEGCAGNPQTWNVTIEDRPNALTITGPDEVCDGEAGVEFEADDFGYNYLWSVPPGASIIGGQGTNRITVNFGSLAGDVMVTPSTQDVGCAGDNATLPVTVNMRPVLANLDKEICSKEGAALVLNYSGVEPAVSYNLLTRVNDAGLFQMSGVDIPPAIIGATDNVLFDQAFENKTGGPLNVRYTIVPVSAKNCPGVSRVVTLRINPEPQLDPNLGKDLCSGEQTEITIRPDVGSAVADKYIIQSIDNPNGLAIDGSAPVLGVELNNDAIYNHRWLHPGAPLQPVSPIDITYRIIPKNSGTGCLGDPPLPVSLRIFPKPVIDPVTDNPKEICSNDDVNIQLTSSNVNTATLSWTVDFAGPNITGAKAGSASVQPVMIDDVLINQAFVQDGVRYRVLAENPLILNSCKSDPYVVEVNVNPSPNTVESFKGEACSDNPNNGLVYTANLTSLHAEISSSAGIDFDWFQDNPPTVSIPDPANYAMTHGVKVFVQVTNITSGCKKVVPVEYQVNNDVGLSLSKTDLSCFENNSGRVTAEGLFGTAPYSFSIDGGPFIAAGASYTFQFLSANSYSVEIRDSNGCLDNGTISLNEPPQLSTSITKADVSCFFDSDGVLDKDGRVEVTASGGTAPYKEFILLPSNIKNTVDGNFSGLRPGTYSVKIIDQNDCAVETQQVTLVSPTQLEITSINVADDGAGNNLSCRDATDGEITVTAQGGNVPYDYIFSIATVNNPNTPVNQISGSNISPITFADMGEGTYMIVVSDDKGCRSAPGAAIIVNPLPFHPGMIGLDHAVCFGDDASQINQLVAPFGGVGNYQFQWQWSTDLSIWNDIPAVEGGNQAQYDPGVLPESTYFRRLVRSVSARTGSDCGVVKGDGPAEKVLVTVNPLPQVLFQPDQNYLCQGDPLILRVSLVEGTGALPLHYTYQRTTSPGDIPNQISPQIIIPSLTDDETFTLTFAKDGNGCVANNTPIAQPITVIKVSPDFNIVGPNAQCPGSEFEFRWNVESGIHYSWEWFDGTDPDTYTAGTLPVGQNPVYHTFSGVSTANRTTFPVRLTASDEFGLCLPKSATREVIVFPSLALNMLPQDLILCSGEELIIKDQSLGVDKGTWYYHDLNSPQTKIDQQNGPVNPLTFIMHNNTENNPIIYEVVYEAENNDGCKAEYREEVLVYRTIQAQFSIDDVPPFAGGASKAVFTNTSTPPDGPFEFNWDDGYDWGDSKASLLQRNDYTYTVEYYSPGEREITLKAVNVDYPRCLSIVTATINIDQPDLNADFKVTPLASCFPVNVEATNLSPGADTFYWELKMNGELVDESRLRNPSFRIIKPGTYELTLTASYSASSQPPVVKGPVIIQVFDVPSAIFELFQSQVYIPGTEVKTINKSVRANVYEWDFDDGFYSTEIQPTHLYALEGQYTITLRAGHDYGEWDTDGDGTKDKRIICYDSTQRVVTVLEGGSLRIPNAFTPNVNRSSGGVYDPNAINDVFLPIMDGVEEFNMQIFDRWGNLLFETSDKNIGWDGYDRNGRLMPAGVYVYKLVVRLGDNQRTTKLGDVTLIR